MKNILLDVLFKIMCAIYFHSWCCAGKGGSSGCYCRRCGINYVHRWTPWKWTWVEVP